jgi:hypothetical protein
VSDITSESELENPRLAKRRSSERQARPLSCAHAQANASADTQLCVCSLLRIPFLFRLIVALASQTCGQQAVMWANWLLGLSTARPLPRMSHPLYLQSPPRGTQVWRVSCEETLGIF